MSDVEVLPGATTALHARIAELVAERDDLAFRLGEEVGRSRAAEAELAAVRTLVGGDPATPVSEVLRAQLVRFDRVYEQLAIQQGMAELGAIIADPGVKP